MLASGADKPLSTHGYLVAVAIVDGGKTTPQQVHDRLTDSLYYMDDIGDIDIEDLGIIECFDEKESNNGNT